jgi:hypothetical protein
MKTTFYASLTAISLLLTSCCCFEPAILDEDSPIIVREATLPEFNSRFIGNNPEPTFNIAMFKFPETSQSSGELPNDRRFQDGTWTNVVSDYPSRGLTSYYIFSSPPNSMISGDLMVVQANPQLQEAVLRVKGSLFKLPPNPAITDNATTFANEIRKFIASQTPPAGMTVCKMLASQVVKFGTTVPTSTRAYDTMYVRTNAGADTNVAYPNNWPTGANGILLPPIKNGSDINTYEITVKAGDWFFYTAANGGSFFVVFTNIQSGVLTPNIDRVTFKFAEAYQCIDCKKQ